MRSTYHDDFPGHRVAARRAAGVPADHDVRQRTTATGASEYRAHFEGQAGKQRAPARPHDQIGVIARRGGAATTTTTEDALPPHRIIGSPGRACRGPERGVLGHALPSPPIPAPSSPTEYADEYRRKEGRRRPDNGLHRRREHEAGVRASLFQQEGVRSPAQRRRDMRPTTAVDFDTPEAAGARAARAAPRHHGRWAGELATTLAFGDDDWAADGKPGAPNGASRVSEAQAAFRRGSNGARTAARPTPRRRQLPRRTRFDAASSYATTFTRPEAAATVAGRRRAKGSSTARTATTEQQQRPQRGHRASVTEQRSSFKTPPASARPTPAARRRRALRAAEEEEGGRLAFAGHFDDRIAWRAVGSTGEAARPARTRRDDQGESEGFCLTDAWAGDDDGVAEAARRRRREGRARGTARSVGQADHSGFPAGCAAVAVRHPDEWDPATGGNGARVSRRSEAQRAFVAHDTRAARPAMAAQRQRPHSEVVVGGGGKGIMAVGLTEQQERYAPFVAGASDDDDDDDDDLVVIDANGSSGAAAPVRVWPKPVRSFAPKAKAHIRNRRFDHVTLNQAYQARLQRADENSAAAANTDAAERADEEATPILVDGLEAGRARRRKQVHSKTVPRRHNHTRATLRPPTPRARTIRGVASGTMNKPKPDWKA